MRRPLVIYDVATAPFWIFLYMRKISFSFFTSVALKQLKPNTDQEVKLVLDPDLFWFARSDVGGPESPTLFFFTNDQFSFSLARSRLRGLDEGRGGELVDEGRGGRLVDEGRGGGRLMDEGRRTRTGDHSYEGEDRGRSELLYRQWSQHQDSISWEEMSSPGWIL